MGEFKQKDLYETLTVCAVILGCITGLASAGLMIVVVTDTFWAIIPALVCAAFTAGLAYAAIEFGQRIEAKVSAFDNAAEREVLDPRQRKELRKARGSVVMERALLDVEHARENTIHKTLADSTDDDTPPYETKFDKAYPQVNNPPQIRGGA